MDAAKLGDEFMNVRKPHPQTVFGGFTITIPEAQKIISKARGWQWIIAKQAIAYKLDFRMRRKTKRHRRLTAGNALVGMCLKTLIDLGVPVWRSSPLKSLVQKDGAVTGAVVTQEGVDVLIKARRGVIMAAGGFEHNPKMRKKYLPAPTETEWSATPGQNTGDGHVAAADIGANLTLMNGAWWGPSVRLPGADRASILFAERALPGVYIVNEKGERYLNEGASYDEVGRQLQAHPLSSWIVFDRAARKKYAIGPLYPASVFPDSKWHDSIKSVVRKASTLEELAAQMGVDARGLVETARRVTRFSESGIDEDFDKGGNAYDRHYGDQTVTPNPCMGPLATPPFYAFPIRPGDIGTKGGIDVNAQAQALDKKGKVISGLYAIGNCASSVMGHTYPGAGSTIGPAMTFGFVAAKHAMQTNQ
jgi:3-oxosteroid 1-dehydrogenase